MVAPHAGQPIDQRHRRIRILVDIDHREVGRDVAGRERQKRDGDEEELRQSCRYSDAHEHRIVGTGADDRHNALDQRQTERQHQGVMAKFCDHLLAPATGCADACG